MRGVEGCQKRLREVGGVGESHVKHSIGGNLNARILRDWSFRNNDNRHDAAVTACFVEISKIERVVFYLPLRLQTVRLVFGFEFETDNYVRSQQHCIKPLVP